MARRTRRSERPKFFETRLVPAFPAAPLGLALLVLVFFFLMATPLLNRAARSNLPAATQVEPVPPLATRTLSIESKGLLLLDGKRVDAGDIDQALSEMARQSPQPLLRLRAARGLTFRQVKKVVDQAHIAGIEDIRLEVAVSPRQASEIELAPQDGNSR